MFAHSGAVGSLAPRFRGIRPANNARLRRDSWILLWVRQLVARGRCMTRRGSSARGRGPDSSTRTCSPTRSAARAVRTRARTWSLVVAHCSLLTAHCSSGPQPRSRMSPMGGALSTNVSCVDRKGTVAVRRSSWCLTRNASDKGVYSQASPCRTLAEGHGRGLVPRWGVETQQWAKREVTYFG